MNENKKAKVAVVNEVQDKLNTSKAMVIAEYQGLTVKELQDLRAQLEEHKVELKVFKNRLFKIAAQNAGHDLDQYLDGANIYAFGMEDEISPAKILANFAKEHQALKLKAGIYEGKVIGEDEVKEVAALPSLEEALTMLATSLLAPVNQIGKGLQLLIDENKLDSSSAKTEESQEETKAETEKKENQETPPQEESSKSEESSKEDDKKEN